MVLLVLKTFYRYHVIGNQFSMIVDMISFQDAAKVCQNFMSRDPSELHFTVVALSAAS